MKQTKINILFLFWGRKGGGAKYSLEIAKELSLRDDTNLHLSISSQCELGEQFLALSEPIFYVDTYKNALEFIHTYFIKKNTLKKQLRKYLQENKMDVVIVGMDFFWGAIINEAASSLGVKTILVIHEPKPHPKESPPMVFLKMRNLKKSIPGASHVVALTEHVKQYIADAYGVDNDIISVIPHGIFSYYKTDGPRRLRHDQDKIKILYFGRIDYYKGLDILLEAFCELEQVKNNVQLEIWGSGDISPYEEQVRKIQNIHIENRWIGEDEIAAVFKTCDICVLPYREASQSGIAGIASHAAMPVVACPSEGLKEQLSDYGADFSEDFTPQSLRKALQNLIENPDVYHQQSKLAVEYGNRISWEAIAADFHDISAQLISVSK